MTDPPDRNPLPQSSVPLTVNPADVAPPPTDADLARSIARTGDRRAAEELVRRHQRPLRSFLFSLCRDTALADDLAQDVFVRALRHCDRFDPAYPMQTWLFTIARRLFISDRRRLTVERHHRRTLALASISACNTDATVLRSDPVSSASSAPRDPLRLAAQRDQRAALAGLLDRAIAQLSDPQRQSVILFHQQGLSVEDAATVMEMPVGTVKSHLHRARARLRELLESDPVVRDSLDMAASGDRT